MLAAKLGTGPSSEMLTDRDVDVLNVAGAWKEQQGNRLESLHQRNHGERTLAQHFHQTERSHGAAVLFLYPAHLHAQVFSFDSRSAPPQRVRVLFALTIGPLKWNLVNLCNHTGGDDDKNFWRGFNER